MEPTFNDVINSNRKTAIYGPPGTGKSTAVSQAERVVFIPTEDGLGSISCSAFPLCTSLGDVAAALTWLENEDHDFKTVAIDSADWLEQLIWQKVCRVKSVEAITEIDWGKGYGLAASIFSKILARIDAIRKDQDLHFVFIAHSKIERFEDPECSGYDRYAMKLDKRVEPLLSEWADEVLFCNTKTRAKSVHDKNGEVVRTLGKADGQRTITCVGRPAAMAKNRLGMPDEIPMDWKEYEKFFKKGSPSDDK